MAHDREGMDARIAEALRGADPLRAGSTMSREQTALMRSAILEEADRAAPSSWLPVAAGAALAALSIVAVLFVRLPETHERASQRDPARSTREAPFSRITTAEESVSVRTIHFTTPGGTRVVWSLVSDPDPVPGRRTRPGNS